MAILVCEGPHQLDLPLGKWLDPLTRQVHHANRLVLAH
jgi:hypothetical protein